MLFFKCSIKLLDLPVCDNEKLLIDKEYVKFLVHLSNQKLEQTHARIAKMEEKFKKFSKL